MNTQPDEILITQWMDGELTGDDLARMDAYAAENPELLELRAQSQSIAAEMKGRASSDVPYADFFTTQVMRKIELEDAGPTAVPTKSSFIENLSQWMLPTALAMMAVSFYLGTQLQGLGTTDQTAENAEVYTADSRVEARLVAGKGDSPTVIVLTGWESESDALDLVEYGNFAAPVLAAHRQEGDSTLGATLSF